MNFIIIFIHIVGFIVALFSKDLAEAIWIVASFVGQLTIIKINSELNL